MEEVRFWLDIPAEEMLRFYHGVAQSVAVRAFDGRRVRFPAESLRPFVTSAGVRGTFRLRFDGHHKLLDLQKVA